MAREDTSTDVRHIALALSSGAQGTVLAAIPGQKIKLVALLGSMSADGSIKLQSNNNDLSGAIGALANLPFGFRSDKDVPLCKTVAGEALKITTVGGAFNGIAVVYVEGE